MSLADQRVLVTGASSGLGREIARRLATKHRAHVVLTARREDRLADLARELQARGCPPAEVVPADLSVASGVSTVVDAIRRGPVPAAAVLNAGVTYYGHVLDQAPADASTLLRTNVENVVHLSRALADLMARGSGHGSIQFVTSLTAFAPCPTQALYGASKAFITHYALALAHEMKPHGVHVGVFCPGGIATELLEKAGLDRKFSADQMGMMTAERCAASAVAALIRRRRHAVPGLLNRFLGTLMRFAPRSLATAVVANLYENGEQTRWQKREELSQTPVP